MWIVGFLLVLGPLITIHELGHYLVGRWFGVKAEAFSIGFGKELTGWTDRHGTRWKLSALPLGGYVQFKGDMNPASIPDAQSVKDLSPEERDGNFHHAALWKRALIVFAGPATNILVAILIFAAFALSFGKPVTTPVISGFAEQSAGREAGLEIGDRVVALDGERIEDFREVVEEVIPYPGRQLTLTVERGGDQLDIPVTAASTIQTDRFGNESRIGLMGVYSDQRALVPVSLGGSLVFAANECVRIAKMMVTGIKQIVTGQRSVKELGGPVKIAKFSGERLSLGPLAFIEFVALISLNLAFINLLPIPALDGGHLAFYAAEAVRRKPVGAKGTEMAYRAGIAMVLALMVFVTVNDVISLPIFGG